MKNSEEFTDLHPKGSANDVRFFDLDREIVRPCLYFKRVLLKTVVVFLIATALGITASVVFNRLGLKNGTLYSVLISAFAVVLATVIKLKSILIWLVMVYQKFAPERVRKRCVFNPSCSEYMILAIKKYGVIKGVKKGIKRLKRCHLPNFGDDYP